MVSDETITITARDVTGQRRLSQPVPRTSTVDELIRGFGERMQLLREDGEGRPVTWSARLVREGRALHRSERVGEAMQDLDEIRLQPEISAGAIKGKVMRKKTVAGFAPRSSAASSSESSNPARRDCTMTVT